MAEWRDVVGYEGLYQVSDGGHVRSLDRVVPHARNVHRHIKGQYIRPSINRAGYFKVGLSRDGCRDTQMVHRLVAKAFLCQAAVDSTEVNHKSGNKLDNRVCNLEWVTPSQNMRHAFATGLNHKRESHAQVKMNAAKVRVLRRCLEMGMTLRESAAVFGIREASACFIRQGRNWPHVTHDTPLSELCA